ncbi:hypothetical protein NLI96_g10140 [Meripilus lineatus]|uniref:Uncharacterized protein n=1 Tax=Meripilus lineatus TaxID=2056292 RepID=A0AAD5YEL2_9APHY|nr:hypothetical protein NLI96_g10140 [Physisporinus lineatus]
MNITSHSFEDLSPTSLPPQVSRLVDVLQAPLPKWLDFEKLTSWCKERRVHELNEFCDAHMDDEVYGRLMVPLRDVISLALRIEAVSSDPFSPCQTRHLWSSLIAQLGFLSNPHVETLSILSDQPFAQPKGFSSDEGTASMLISFQAERAKLDGALNPKELSDPFDHPQWKRDSEGDDTETKESVGGGSEEVESQEEDTETKASEEAEGEEQESAMNVSQALWPNGVDDFYYPRIPEYDEADIFFGIDRESASTPPLVDWLDLLSHTHILSSSHVWPVAIFPVFSVADSTNIIPLVASIACQRTVWGLQLPVVAFEISNVDRVGHIHIGWAEQNETHTVPSIHVIRPSRTPVSGRLTSATFDLGVPESATRFGQFILSLSHQYHTIGLELPIRVPDTIKWRSDDMPPMLEKLELGLHERVKDWSKDVPVDIDPLSSSDSRYNSRLHTLSQRLTELACLDSSSEIQTHVDDSFIQATGFPPEGDIMTKTNSTPCTDASQTKPSSQKEESCVSTRMDAAQTPNLQTKASCNVTSKTSPRRLHPIVMIGTCGLERRGEVLPQTFERTGLTLRRTCQRELGVTQPEAVVSLHQNFLDSWPKQDGPNSQFLEKEYAEIVQPRFPVMWQIVRRSTLIQVSPITGSREVDSRLSWDYLLGLAYVDSADEIKSDRLLLEANLRMSQNQLAKCPLDGLEKTLAKLEKLAELNRQLCLQANREAIRTKKEGRLLESYSLRASAVADLVNNLINATKDLEGTHTAILKRARIEAASGMCDALLVAPISVQVDEEDIAGEAYHKYCLVKSALEHPRFAHSSSGQIKVNTPSASTDILYRFPLLDPDEDFVSTSKVFKPSSSSSSKRGFLHSLKEILIYLPQLVVEYKKVDGKSETALNQVRTHLLASVSYLASLGILDHPVFGLVVNGTMGFLTMAWKSSSEPNNASPLSFELKCLPLLTIYQAIFIIEHNVKQFDLTNPTQVYHFVTFLIRLRAWEKEMMATVRRKGSKLEDPAKFIKSLYRGKQIVRDHTEWAIRDKEEEPKKEEPKKEGSKKESKEEAQMEEEPKKQPTPTQQPAEAHSKNPRSAVTPSLSPVQEQRNET